MTGTIESGHPGSQIVDFFPVRKLSFFFRFLLLWARFTLKLKVPSFAVKYLPAWLPGMGFKRHALRVRKDGERMENTLFDVAKEYMVRLPQPDIHGMASSTFSRN